MLRYQVGDVFEILRECDLWGIDPGPRTFLCITYSIDEPELWDESEWTARDDEDFHLATIFDPTDDPYEPPYDPYQWVLDADTIDNALENDEIELVAGPSYTGKSWSECPFCGGEVESDRQMKLRRCTECYRKIE